MLKPLLRIIPSYSGNVKILCTTSDYIKSESKEFENDPIDTYDCYVRGATLSPLSHTISDKKIEANLLSSDYSYDLKTFYKYYKDVFYSNGMSIDSNNVQQIDELNSIYDRNIDLEYGCHRSLFQKTGHQFEFFAPIYVDSIDDLPDSFYIELNFHNRSKEVKKKIRVNIMSDFLNKRNYLCHYLSNYGKILNSKVMNISTSNDNATLYGIDLVNGGNTTGIYEGANGLLNCMNTINLFDFSLASSFKECNMAMKQVIPLAFTIDLSKVLDLSQSYSFKGCKVDISGHYSLKNMKVPLYDWDANYTRFNQKILRMNKNTGVLELVNGKLPNIMSCRYPGLHEASISQYSLANKISKMYSRWKMQSSDDDMPYIINLAYPFSLNQESSVNYGMFPSRTFTVTALATSISSKQSSLAEDYSLIFPLGSSLENYKDKYYENARKYEEQMNNYGYNWFDIVDITKDDWIRNVKWKDVDINNECYYDGILHNLSSIYKRLDSSKESLDKFAVIVSPTINYIDSATSERIKRANYTISTSINNQFVANALSNMNAVTTMVSGTDMNKAACEAFLDINPYDYSLNSEIKSNEAYEKVNPDNFDVDDTQARYVNPQDVGFSISYIDDWYDYNDVFDALHTTISYDLSISNLKKVFDDVNPKMLSWAHDILVGSDLCKIGLEVSDPDIFNTYCSYSYELLPLHTMSLILDSYTNSYTNEKEWSYLKFSGNISYIAYNYGIRIHEYKDEKDIERNYTKDEFIYGIDGKQFVYSPGYIEDTNELMNSYSVLKDFLMTYCGINYESIYTVGNIKYYYYVDKYLDFKPYQDSIINDLCISNKQDGKIKKTIGFASYMKSEYEDCSYSYIVFSPQSLITKPYGFNLYREGKFFNHKWIKMSYFEEYRYETLSWMNANKMDIDDPSIETSYSYKIMNITKELSRYMSNKIEEKLNDKTRYMFMPVVFGDGEISAKNVFIKKDDSLEFYGNSIKKENLNKDDDFIWCDVYNFRRILKKGGFTDDEIKDRINNVRKKKARFLNKEHMYWLYNELCRDYDYNYPKDIEENWYDKVYVKNRRIDKDEEGRLQIIDTYVKLSKIPELNDERHPELRKFNFFYNAIETRTIDGLWQFRIDDEDWKYDNVYDFVFDIDVIRLDNRIYDDIINLDGLEDEYKDIYLYRIEKDDEWERKMSSSDISKVNYNDNSYDSWDKPGHLLIPLFNDIYVQDRKDTDIYAHYLLHEITKVSVDDGTFLYRYNTNDIDWMIELGDSSRNYLLSLKDFDLPKILYRKYDSSSIEVNKLYDDLNYNIDNFNTIKGNDGTNYGFWLINVKADNTSNSISMISQYKLDSGDKVTYSYSNNIKWLKYINGINLEENPSYMTRIFKQLMPFLKSQPFEVFSKITTIIVPTWKRLNMIYVESKLGTNTDTSEVTLSSIDNPNNWISYQRYFGNIVPLITQANYVEDQWLLKFKDTKDNSSRIIKYGTFPSIGDSIIYDSSLQIDVRNSTPIYVPSTDKDIKDYNNIDRRIQLLEQKHFNNSRMIYCDDSLEWASPQLYALSETEDLKKESNLYKVWKMLTRDTLINSMTEDQKLFLFNRYESSTSIVPIKLNASKSYKLYKIYYRFDLK